MGNSRAQHGRVLRNRLRELRADVLEVSRQTIIAIENGKFNPSIVLAMKAAAFFGCRIEDIFTLEEAEK
jgi:putative transcriptional regulator